MRSALLLSGLILIGVSGCQTGGGAREEVALERRDVHGVGAICGIDEHRHGLEASRFGEGAIRERAGKADATPSGDLWSRMRRGFRLDGKDHERVRREIERLRRYPEDLARFAENARPFLRFIMDELAQRDMPMELALLPVVESGFDPFAVSPGGAAGLWQFMPATGEWVGLENTPHYDGRRDVIASTRAALDYLQDLSREVGGDWGLALAAYNAGIGRVRAAMRRNRNQQAPVDYWSLDLPRETERYLPRLLALAEIVAEPQRFDVVFPSLPDEPYLAEMSLDTMLDLGVIADLAGVGQEELRRLNPGLRQPLFDPSITPTLLLPAETSDRFARELARLPIDKRVESVRYRVKKGDTLGGIAHRTGSSVDAIRRINGLRGDMLKIGQLLVAPVLPREGRSKLAEAQRDEAGGLIHVVEEGDSLWTVARKYRVGYKSLAAWNRLPVKSVLRPGQELDIRI